MSKRKYKPGDSVFIANRDRVTTMFHSNGNKYKYVKNVMKQNGLHVQLKYLNKTHPMNNKFVTVPYGKIGGFTK